MMDGVFFFNIEFTCCGFSGVGVWIWDGFGMLLSDDWCTFFFNTEFPWLAGLQWCGCLELGWVWDDVG